MDNNETKVLGLCPECGEQVIESPKAYGCANWREGCKFAIWKEDRFLGSMKKEVTEELVETLLRDGKVLVEGLESKKGNLFDAILSYEKDKESGYYKWNMEFPERK